MDCARATFHFLLLVGLVGASSIRSIPVLCYHQLDNDGNLYSTTSAKFAEQISALEKDGYRTISPEQYISWLQGSTHGLPSKPVLITFDDNIKNAAPATAILGKYGFRAVMYVSSGFAEDNNGFYLDWNALNGMMMSGWYMQLHAGPKGHYPITPSQPCDHFYSCRLPNETPEEYYARVREDITVGMAEMQSHGLIIGRSTTFAVPSDSWGQDRTDPVVFNWLQSELQNMFDVVWDQSGYLQGFNRRYRFEIHSTTTLSDLKLALRSPDFEVTKARITPTKPLPLIVSVKPSTSTIVCGAQNSYKHCPSSLPCCSQQGYCGNSSTFCGKGCQSGCTLTEDLSAALADSSDESSSSNSALDVLVGVAGLLMVSLVAYGIYVLEKKRNKKNPYVNVARSNVLQYISGSPTPNGSESGHQDEAQSRLLQSEIRDV